MLFDKLVTDSGAYLGSVVANFETDCRAGKFTNPYELKQELWRCIVVTCEVRGSDEYSQWIDDLAKIALDHGVRDRDIVTTIRSAIRRYRVQAGK
jgi:hypothetical protein